MRYLLIITVGPLLLIYSSCQIRAAEPTCVVSVPVQGEPIGAISDIHEAPGGPLLVAEYGLFRYDGARVMGVPGELTGYIRDFHNTSGGLLLAAQNGLFRYNGIVVARVPGEPTGEVQSFHDTPSGLLLSAQNGLFRYDGLRVTSVPGEPTGGYITLLQKVPNGLLLAASKGLFLYDGARVARVLGEPAGEIKSSHETSGGLFLAAENGLFHYDGTRVVPVAGEPTGDIRDFHETSGGLLLAARNGLFRYDGTRVTRVPGEPTGYIDSLHDTPGGKLLVAENGLFRYDGARVTRAPSEPIGYIQNFHDTSDGLLLAAAKGFFRYDGSHLVPVGGEPTSDVNRFYEIPGGLLVAAMRGVFRYDGANLFRVPGETTGPVYDFYAGSGELLLAAQNGLFRVIVQPLSSSKITLENSRELIGAAPSQLGVPTRWSLTHPCSAFADQFGLNIISRNDKGEDVAMRPAVGFQARGEVISFEATMPVDKAGKWTFRVVSLPTKTNIGAASQPIAFVTSRASGFVEYLISWWRVIAASSGALFLMLNLLVLVAARYSPAAWHLATDESWGHAALLPQRLLLSHWQSAQLWLLDLYVQGRRRTLADKPMPFLNLPLTNREGKVADSENILARIASARHVWIQGGAGMGKTAIFLHLREAHFGLPRTTASAIFRRHGYVLVPIEARRYPEETFSEDKAASAWVVGCVLRALSEGGLTFRDRGLLRAMLTKGTLAVAIDGLNEVAREQAVIAFAAEFPATPVFVTSQEPGEHPFEVWHLPATISEHVVGLLTLYLGGQKGEELAGRLRHTGLILHLRSGYDVRLVTELAESASEGRELPKDRLELYRAAVATAWPVGNERLELLQAAAWKTLSERGPNEDKRRLKGDVDVPRDLLEQLEAVRERSGRSIRLIRRAPPGYEFVHDQMNSYLAACWFAARPTISVMQDLLGATKVWQEGIGAQRTLWGFIAAMLDRPSLEALWIFAGDDDRRAVLGRALAERAEHEGWSLTRPPMKTTVSANYRSRDYIQ